MFRNLKYDQKLESSLKQGQAVWWVKINLQQFRYRRTDAIIVVAATVRALDKHLDKLKRDGKLHVLARPNAQCLFRAHGSRLIPFIELPKGYKIKGVNMIKNEVSAWNERLEADIRAANEMLRQARIVSQAESEKNDSPSPPGTIELKSLWN